MKKVLLTLLISILVCGCMTMPRKKWTFDLDQNEPFQECRLMKVINECYILIQIKDKYYVSKLAGLSFDTNKCHPSWTSEQVRTMKIHLLYDLIKSRSSNLNFYCLDISNDNSEILMVQYDLSGYGNLNRALLIRSSAVYDENYLGVYHKKLREIMKTTENGGQGFFEPFDKVWFDRVISKDFNLDNYSMEIPPIVGEWIPNSDQKKLLEDKYYERTGIKLN